MSHWATDAGSVIVVGRTQTGKTTTAREIHATNRRVSIWLNERGKHRVPNIRGRRVRSLEGLRSGMADNCYKYNWLSSDRKRDIQLLSDWAWSVAERSDRNLEIQVVADELHRLAPQSQKTDLAGRDEIRQIAKEGQKRNISLVGVTQDPISMDKQTLRQREYLLCYPLSAEQSNYMNDYGVDVGHVNNQDDYSGVLYHASGEVLKEGVRARSKFA